LAEATYTFAPATPERWADVEDLFRDSSYPQRCWCAYWYLPNKDFREGWGEGNRVTLEAKVKSGRPPGLLAYDGGMPVGWCAMAPRREHDRLNRSKPFAAIDDEEVWSITCFVVRKGYRRKGLKRRLIGAAVEHGREQGAVVLEGYPVEVKGKSGRSELYFGSLRAFLDNGFVEVARPLPARPMVRRNL
jgi:GNAT superfamily N-acetyltransferase